MGSDFCACQSFFNNESESNILSQTKRNSKVEFEKKYVNQSKKTMEKETLAEDKDNKLRFRDLNNNKNEFFEKPSSSRDKSNQESNTKGIFNLKKIVNEDNSKLNNENNIAERNNNNNNNNTNNINDAFKKQFTFKEMNFRNSSDNKKGNDKKKNRENNENENNNYLFGNSSGKMFNKEKETNNKNEIKEEEDEEQKNIIISKNSFNSNKNSNSPNKQEKGSQDSYKKKI